MEFILGENSACSGQAANCATDISTSNAIGVDFIYELCPATCGVEGSCPFEYGISSHKVFVIVCYFLPKDQNSKI